MAMVLVWAKAEAMAVLARMVVAKARLNLSDFEQMGAARLCKLAMAAIHCELVEATILNLAGFEWAVAAAGLCELAMGAKLKLDSGARGWLM